MRDGMKEWLICVTGRGCAGEVLYWGFLAPGAATKIRGNSLWLVYEYSHASTLLCSPICYSSGIVSVPSETTGIPWPV